MVNCEMKCSKRVKHETEQQTNSVQCKDADYCVNVYCVFVYIFQNQKFEEQHTVPSVKILSSVRNTARTHAHTHTY